MRIAFQNNLPTISNCITTAGRVAAGRSDNVFIHVHPGHDFQSRSAFRTAAAKVLDSSGITPRHGVVAKQMLGGMSGALVIDGSEQLFPILRDLPERFFLIKHAEMGDGNQIVSINGQLNPMVPIRPGEMQFWRSPISARRSSSNAHRRHAALCCGNRRPPAVAAAKAHRVLSRPGQRIDAIAIGPEPGEYAMGTTAFQNEAGGSRTLPSSWRHRV